MSFQPVIPTTGYAGWRFLTRTLPAQQEAFKESAPVVRATEHFRNNIAKVRTVDDLMADRRLLDVALGAFGLDKDIINKAFIRKVLAEGTLKDDAFANKLADKRYAQLARAFGFGDLGARTGLPSFATDIVARFEARRFEAAVGEQNGDMRLALNLAQGLADAATAGSQNAQWFAVMGNMPVRTVFEQALGFPRSFGSIDIDQQLVAFKDRARATFGIDKIADFADPAQQEKLLRLFLIRSEASQGGGLSAGNIALTILGARGQARG